MTDPRGHHSYHSSWHLDMPTPKSEMSWLVQGELRDVPFLVREMTGGGVGMMACISIDLWWQEMYKVVFVH